MRQSATSLPVYQRSTRVLRPVRCFCLGSSFSWVLCAACLPALTVGSSFGKSWVSSPSIPEPLMFTFPCLFLPVVARGGSTYLRRGLPIRDSLHLLLCFSFFLSRFVLSRRLWEPNSGGSCNTW